jgi:hypothetical protein
MPIELPREARDPLIHDLTVMRVQERLAKV